MIGRLVFLLTLSAALASEAGAAPSNRHPVFSLLDNRPLGHWQRSGGLYLPAGAAGMAKYTRFGRPPSVWRLRATEDGRRVALVAAAAVLEVPLTAEQAASRAVHLTLKSPGPSSVKVAARSRSAAPITLRPGWQTVTVTLPEGALQRGENVLNFTFARPGMMGAQRAGAAIELVQIGGPPPSNAPQTMPATRGPLRLEKGSGIAYYTFLPRGGAIAASGESGGCRVTARIDDRTIELRFDGAPIDLGAAGRFARLELVADGPTCSAATLTQADLLADGPAPARAAAAPPRNVVVWLSDDTRADKLKLYNPRSRVETPVFDQLAKTSTLFRVAYTQGNESRISHASLWTSMYPSVHQMIPAKAKLKPEFVTLAEAVKPSGRTTIGVMGNGYIDAFWGFGQGWDVLRNNLHQGGGLRAEDLLATAKRLLDTALRPNDRPFFLYIGTIDAHVSWRAHEPWLGRYDPAPYSGPFTKACLDPQLERIVLGQLKITERDKTRIVALYDSDISYNDRVLGQLLADLERRGHANDTMVIVTSDHGEEFWDHGKIGHGQSLRHELVHVPLLIHYPPYFPAGKVVEEGVDVLDVLPTITDALGTATPAGVQGESLIPLAQGIGAGYPRPAIASQYELAHAMRLDRYKLWVGGAGEARLFDAAGDPREDHELSAERPIERRALTDAFGLFMANRSQWHKRRWGVASNLHAEFAADLDR